MAMPTCERPRPTIPSVGRPPDAVQAVDVVVTMGCGDTCPVDHGTRHEDWRLDDPAGQDLAAVRTIRDDVERRVRALIAGLG